MKLVTRIVALSILLSGCVYVDAYYRPTAVGYDASSAHPGGTAPTDLVVTRGSVRVTMSFHEESRSALVYFELPSSSELDFGQWDEFSLVDLNGADISSGARSMIAWSYRDGSHGKEFEKRQEPLRGSQHEFFLLRIPVGNAPLPESFSLFMPDVTVDGVQYEGLEVRFRKSTALLLVPVP